MIRGLSCLPFLSVILLLDYNLQQHLQFSLTIILMNAQHHYFTVLRMIDKLFLTHAQREAEREAIRQAASEVRSRSGGDASAADGEGTGAEEDDDEERGEGEQPRAVRLSIILPSK